MSPQTENSKIPAGTFAIVQLSRFGDVIQTLQAAMELKGKFPKTRLILIGRERFCKPLEFKLKATFDEIHYLNTKKLVTTAGEQSLSKVQTNLAHFVDTINKSKIDVTINLTYSKSSSYLTSLIDSKYKLGLVRNERNETIINDSWSQFIYSNTMNGPYSPFNLVDIFKGILGVKGSNYPKDHKDINSKKIIVHPFASQVKKRWPLSKWTEVIYQILKNNPDSSITLMGAPNELEQANEILQNPILKTYLPKIKNLVGKTSIQELYEEFKDTALFIGHDSMGGHLASLYNVQTLTVSLGTVRPYETSPYGNNNYTLAPRINCFPCFVTDACELLPCHKDVSYNAISKVVEMLLKKKDINPESLKAELPVNFLGKIDIYCSEVDTTKGYSLNSVLHAEGTIVDIFRNFYKILWGFILSGSEENLPFPELNKEKFNTLHRHLRGVENLLQLNKFGKTYSGYIIDEVNAQTPDVKKIKTHSERLAEIDQLAKTLKQTYPHLSPLVDFYQVSRANIPGVTVKQMAEFCYISYHEASNSTQVLTELISATLKSSPLYAEFEKEQQRRAETNTNDN